MPDVSYSIGGVRNEQQTEADRTRARMAQMMFEREMRERAESVARQNAQLGADLTREGWARQDALSERGLGFQRDMLKSQADLARYGMDREDARSERGLQFQKGVMDTQAALSREERAANEARFNAIFGEDKADRALSRRAMEASLGGIEATNSLLQRVLSGEVDPDSLPSFQRSRLGIEPSAKQQVKSEAEVEALRAGTTAGRRALLREQEQGFQAIGKGVQGETWFSGKNAELYANQAAMIIASLREAGADDQAIEMAKQRLINEVNLGASDWTFGDGGPQLKSLISRIKAL